MYKSHHKCLSDFSIEQPAHFIFIILLTQIYQLLNLAIISDRLAINY